MVPAPTRRSAFLFAVGGVLLAGLVFASVIAFRKAVDAVDHTHDVRLAINQLDTFLSRAQSLERGYIITGDPVFLKPFDECDQAWRVDLERLRALTADDPEQQRSLEELEAMLSVRFLDLRDVMRVRDTQGEPAAAEAVRRDVPQTPTRKIRGVIARIDGTEQRLMAQRRRRAELFNGAVFVALFLAGITAATALVITLRRRVEAERLTRLGESFVAVLGHDLRNPLSAVVTGAQLLAGSSDERVARTGARMQRSALRMARMIDQVLDLTRIRLGGGLPVRPIALNLEETTRHIIDELSAANPARGLALDVIGDANGEWDEDRIAQLLSNLIGNAMQHGDADTKVEVRLDGSAAGQVELDVANRGSVPPEVRGRLFDPFYAPHLRPGRREGLGLGLYICREIARAHGGSIELLTERDETRLRVRLPRVPHLSAR